MHYKTYVILPLGHPVSNICRGMKRCTTSTESEKNEIVLLVTPGLHNFGRYVILWYTLKKNKQIKH